MCRVMADTSGNATGAYAPANWVALSSDVGADDAGHTVLANELTGGTMARVHASYAHTDGTASYTLIATFTSDRIVDVTKYSVFNAASGGTMAFEQSFSEAVPLKIGDTLQVVDTIAL
jgi:hypothetical protein